MHYVKLWSNLVRSSILEQELPVRWLWIVLLLEADQAGNVYGTQEALARIANLTVDQVKQALAALMAPDPSSTTEEEDGRRLLNPSANLWYIVNYHKYRGIKDAAQEREKVKERVRKHRDAKRARAADVTQTVTGVTQSVTPGNPIVDVDVEVEAEVRNKDLRDSCPTHGVGRVLYPEEFLLFWKDYPRKIAKGRALRAWQQIKAPRPAVDALLASIASHKTSADWLRDDGQYIPHPASWLNARGWEDEISDVHRSQSGIALPPLKGV